MVLNFWTRLAATALITLSVAAHAQTNVEAAPDRADAETSVAPAQAARVVADGKTSYYGHEFGGRRTASGQTFNPHALTMAHRSLPFGTWVRVTNLNNLRSVVVQVTDRGPFKAGRICDVSLAAAKKLGMVAAGLAMVKLEVVQKHLLPQRATRVAQRRNPSTAQADA